MKRWAEIKELLLKIRTFFLGGVALVAIVFLLFFTNFAYQVFTQRTIDNVLIKEKQVSTESDKKTGKVTSTYLIFTDHGVFRNDDAFWFFKFNSSDFYGGLDVGKHYDLKVYGFRIPYFSMYPNIVRMKDVPPPVAAAP